jgi:hypothetical protein
MREPGSDRSECTSAGELLRLRPLGIDTHREHVVYMHRDCAVCRSEGSSALARVEGSMDPRESKTRTRGACHE